MELLATNDAGRVLQFDSHFSIMQDGIRKEIGKYFIDISKLVFGGSVFASIMNIEDISRI